MFSQYNMLNSVMKTALLPTFCAESKKKSSKSQGLEKPVEVTLSKVIEAKHKAEHQCTLYQWATNPLGDQISAESTGIHPTGVLGLKRMTPIDILHVVKKEAKWAHLIGKPLVAVTGLIFIPCLPIFELALGPELNGLELFRHPKNRHLNIKKWRFLSASRYVIEQIKMQFLNPKTRSLAFLSAGQNPWLTSSNQPESVLVDMWQAHRVMDLLVEKRLLDAVYKPIQLKQGEPEQQLFLGYTLTPLAYQLLQQAKEAHLKEIKARKEGKDG